MRDVLKLAAILGLFAVLGLGFGIHPFQYLEDAVGLFGKESSAQDRREDREQRMWIVLTFQASGGREAQMSFNNPSVPRMRPSECQAVLASATPGLVEAARAREPALGNLPFFRSDCVASETDPLRPR
jgi:hypothetical protein